MFCFNENVSKGTPTFKYQNSEWWFDISLCCAQGSLKERFSNNCIVVETNYNISEIKKYKVLKNWNTQVKVPHNFTGHM